MTDRTTDRRMDRSGNREASHFLLRWNRMRFGLQMHQTIAHGIFKNKHEDVLSETPSTSQLDITNIISGIIFNLPSPPHSSTPQFDSTQSRPISSPRGNWIRFKVRKNWPQLQEMSILESAIPGRWKSRHRPPTAGYTREVFFQGRIFIWFICKI